MKATDEVNLLNIPDGKVWADEFCRIAKSKGIELDADWMHTWFANAIMCGYDQRNREDLRTTLEVRCASCFTVMEKRELGYYCARCQPQNANGDSKSEGT